jgi:hypothetical protein
VLGGAIIDKAAPSAIAVGSTSDTGAGQFRRTLIEMDAAGAITFNPGPIAATADSSRARRERRQGRARLPRHRRVVHRRHHDARGQAHQGGLLHVGPPCTVCRATAEVACGAVSPPHVARARPLRRARAVGGSRFPGGNHQSPGGPHHARHRQDLLQARTRRPGRARGLHAGHRLRAVIFRRGRPRSRPSRPRSSPEPEHRAAPVNGDLQADTVAAPAGPALPVALQDASPTSSTSPPRRSPRTAPGADAFMTWASRTVVDALDRGRSRRRSGSPPPSARARRARARDDDGGELEPACRRARAPSDPAEPRPDRPQVDPSSQGGAGDAPRGGRARPQGAPAGL